MGWQRRLLATEPLAFPFRGVRVASCLTRQRNQVAVLEQHYLSGGCCHTFQYGDYSFCADVHYIYQCSPGKTVDRFLNYLGKTVPFNTLDPDCIDRVITPDVDFRISLGWERFRDRLLTTFPNKATALNQYCDAIAQLH
jgi:all-trans-retinol 13,14-reductase